MGLTEEEVARRAGGTRERVRELVEAPDGHVEQALEEAGLHRKPEPCPEACAFADLSGFHFPDSACAVLGSLEFVELAEPQACLRRMSA